MTKILSQPPRGARLLVVFLMALVLCGPASASFVVSVGGQNYRLALVGADDSFASAESEATANSFFTFDQTPWWNDKGFATSVADAVRSFFGSSDESYRVPWQFSNSNQSFVEYAYAVTPSDRGRTGANINSGSVGDGGAVSHVWVTEVPEVDGPVLAQAIFILGSLYLIVRGQIGRRRMVV